MAQDAAYRRSNRRRRTQAGYADRVAHSIVGTLLAQAFVATRAHGFKLVVGKIDGVPHVALRPHDRTINVDVERGLITRSRVTVPC